MNYFSLLRFIGFSLSSALVCAAPAYARVTPECEPPAEPPQSEAAYQVRAAPQEESRVAEERTGSLPVRDGQRLRLNTEVGNVRVHTTANQQVIYRVRIETAKDGPAAQKILKQFVLVARPAPDGVQITGSVPREDVRGRLWVNFDLNVPRSFQLDIETKGGSIETESISGRISLVTAGGNLTAGDVGGPARLETQGGHVTVQSVKGDLSAYSAGGHINVGVVEGDAVVRTGGGHVRVGEVKGTAQLETGGGNIFLQKPGGNVTANSSGGRIDFGEAAAGIRARTGGGNIGIMRVTGPAELESSGGSISLTRVQGAIKASTASGPITAYLMPAGSEKKLGGPSQLISGQGDIVVFVPRQLPVTIEAVIEAPGEHRIEADPDFPMKVSYGAGGSANRPIYGEAALNGGGELLKLRTVNGSIRLRWADGFSPALAAARSGVIGLPFDSFLFRFEAQQKALENSLRQQQETLEQSVKVKAWDVAHEKARAEVILDRLRMLVNKDIRVSVSGSEMKDKVAVAPRPAYPLLAIKNRIEGRVRVEVVLNPSGEIESVRLLSGHPLLGEAATDAVRQWRYAPTLFDGHPVSVVTTVDFDFKLN